MVGKACSVVGVARSVVGKAPRSMHPPKALMRMTPPPLVAPQVDMKIEDPYIEERQSEASEASRTELHKAFSGCSLCTQILIFIGLGSFWLVVYLECVADPLHLDLPLDLRLGGPREDRGLPSPGKSPGQSRDDKAQLCQIRQVPSPKSIMYR